MVLNVACRDEGLTVGSRRLVDELSTRLPRYFGDILRLDWDLQTEGSEHVVGCRLHSHSGFFRATARDMDPLQAMHQAFDKLVRQRSASHKRRRGGARGELPIRGTA